MTQEHTELNCNVAQVVDGANAFAIDLFNETSGTEAGNLFFSPSSISLAFAMTFAGARGRTADEMAEVLHFALHQPELHEAYRALQANTKTGGVELRIANRLWGQHGYHFLEDFLATTEQFYDAKLAEVDFVHAFEEARQLINEWIEGQTAHKIRELIPPGVLNPSTRLVLTNAIYFLGSWENEFDESATNQAPFWIGTNESESVPMMRQVGHFDYGEFEDLQVLELPYLSEQVEWRPVKLDVGEVEIEGSEPIALPDSGSNFALYLLLPKKRDGLKDVGGRDKPAMKGRVEIGHL